MVLCYFLQWRKCKNKHLIIFRDLNIQIYIYKLEYCCTRGKEIVFAQRKQSIPRSINDFAEMNILVCLLCFPFIQKLNLPEKKK